MINVLQQRESVAARRRRVVESDLEHPVRGITGTLTNVADKRRQAVESCDVVVYRQAVRGQDQALANGDVTVSVNVIEGERAAIGIVAVVGIGAPRYAESAGGGDAVDLDRPGTKALAAADGGFVDGAVLNRTRHKSRRVVVQNDGQGGVGSVAV